jgi:hypothetical protein
MTEYAGSVCANQLQGTPLAAFLCRVPCNCLPFERKATAEGRMIRADARTCATGSPGAGAAIGGIRSSRSRNIRQSLLSMPRDAATR